MPKLFIFAIGGTGERVLRSFTMVLASGAPTFDNYEVFPIIIDYDADNADKSRTVDLLKNYANVHNAAYGKHGQTKAEFFSAKIVNLNGLKNYVFPFEPATPNEKFREYIGYDSLAGETLTTSNLLKSLYDESNRPDTELNLDMTVGFKGNPNIGSVVFHTIRETEEFRNFTARFQPDNGDKVVIIGSLFGGTGASGIPEIVKAIKDKTKGAKIATILVLPYFAPMEKKDGAIQASRFNSKTKAALSYYKDSGLMSQIDKVYYVGDFYPTIIQYSEGGKDQKNNANLVELIASMMIEHYVAERGDGQQEFKFSLEANIVVKGGQKSGQRLYIKDFDQISVTYVLNHLVKLAIALKTTKDEILSKKASKIDFFKILNLQEAIVESESIGESSNQLRNLCSALEQYYSKLQGWFKELDFEGKGDATPANSHRFGLCDMERNYPNIVLKEEEKEEKGKGYKDYLNKISKKNLDADYLYARMDSRLHDAHYDTIKKGLKEGLEPEYVFADILHSAAEDGFTLLN